MKTTKLTRLTLTVLAALVLAGCSQLRFTRPNSAEPDVDLVAQNLVFALAQLKSIHPMQTTIQMKRATSAFGQQVETRIREAGYGVQRVSADQGANYVRYSAERSISDSGRRTLYSVSIGDVVAEREYSVSKGHTVPNAEMVVSGVGSQSVKLNDNIFERDDSSPAFPSEVLFNENEAAIVVDLVTGESQVFSDSEAANAVTAVQTPATPTSFAGSVRQNMFETMSSNYAQVFGGYSDVRSEVLVFANDSLRLGEKNKKIIQDYVRAMDPETDILSIIGCSHGKTKLNNGNSLLALGRANRVKEAFLFSGVSHEVIYDEGCWAPTHFDGKMPRRGVVLTHKRIKELG